MNISGVVTPWFLSTCAQRSDKWHPTCFPSSGKVLKWEWLFAALSGLITVCDRSGDTPDCRLVHFLDAEISGLAFTLFGLVTFQIFAVCQRFCWMGDLKFVEIYSDYSDYSVVSDHSKTWLSAKDRRPPPHWLISDLKRDVSSSVRQCCNASTMSPHLFFTPFTCWWLQQIGKKCPVVVGIGILWTCTMLRQ